MVREGRRENTCGEWSRSRNRCGKKRLLHFRARILHKISFTLKCNRQSLGQNLIVCASGLRGRILFLLASLVHYHHFN